MSRDVAGGAAESMEHQMTDEEPNFTLEPLRSEVLSLFEEWGARGEIRYTKRGSGAEVVFVVTTAGAADMNELELTRDLTVLLRRKVAVATYSDGWADQTAILE
jgi:hypothetical protein